MNKTEIEQRVWNVFGRVFPSVKGQAPVLERTQETVAEWDSFGHLELIGAMEKEFDISFTLQEAQELHTPRAFAESISEKVQ